MKLSIVVPVYGVEKTLAKCLDSILAQTFGDYELILVDDGSKDGSPAIIDEYARRDARIVAVHQPNGGYSSAMNHGIGIARGEWIGIVEPDDWIEPDMYERLVSAIREEVDVVKCNLAWTSEDGRSFPHDWRGKRAPKDPFGIVEAPYFFQEHPSIWTCIYRTSFLREKAIRFTEATGASWTDNLFQVQTLYLSRKIAYVDAVGYHYGVGPLRNMMTPFVRSHEIHDWLEAQGMLEPALWNCLYWREMSYVDLAFEAAGWKKGAWKRETRRLIARWDPAHLLCGAGLTRDEAALVRRFVAHPIFFVVAKRVRAAVKFGLRIILYPIVVATRPIRCGRRREG